MSTLPSVVRRFIEYYTALDSQPPSALVGLYHSNAALIDPFGEHDGIFALQRYFTHLLAWRSGSIPARNTLSCVSS